MQLKEFDSLREQAVALFKSQPTKGERISLDAIFTTLTLLQPQAKATRAAARKITDDPPEWFRVAAYEKELAKFLSHKKEFTVSELMVATKEPDPGARWKQVRVGRWLREKGVKDRKIGGVLLFNAQR